LSSLWLVVGGVGGVGGVGWAGVSEAREGVTGEMWSSPENLISLCSKG
jgi:hypothetical protein